MEENIILPPSFGTTLKIVVSGNLGQYHLSDVDFSCCFFADCQRSHLVIKKGDAKMLYMDDDHYLAVVDTRKVGVGQYHMKVTAMIPDPDIEGGFREEVVTIELKGVYVRR